MCADGRTGVLSVLDDGEHAHPDAEHELRGGFRATRFLCLTPCRPRGQVAANCNPREEQAELQRVQQQLLVLLPFGRLFDFASRVLIKRVASPAGEEHFANAQILCLILPGINNDREQEVAASLVKFVIRPFSGDYASCQICRLRGRRPERSALRNE